MKNLYFLICLLSSYFAVAQENVCWNEAYDIQLSDFKSKATKIGNGNSYSLFLPSTIQFNVSMTNFEFAVTKNFNDKVVVRFSPEAAILIAPDDVTAQQLVSFANFQFDLAELYARKLRKELFVNKSVYTTITYIQSPFDANQKEYTARFSSANVETDMGRETDKLKKLHEEVLQEIDELASFCDSCKIDRKSQKI